MRLLLLLPVLLCLAFAPAPLPKPRRQGEAPPSMVGDWRRANGGSTVRIAGETWTNGYENGSRPSFTIKLHPLASPPAFDLYDFGKPAIYLRGIYKVEGDTLTITYSAPPKERPSAFAGAGLGTGVEVMTRVR